jgi:ribosomal protein S18 acetylase RimI-like enzyme
VTNTKGTARRATEADLNAVLALDSAAPIGHQRADLLASRVDSGEVLVFERDARLVGFAVVTLRSFFGFDFVELLSVGENDRRSGVGSSLLDEAASQSSKNRIFISTNQSNGPMIRLLENAEWQFSGRLEGIDEGDPELVYFKYVR